MYKGKIPFNKLGHLLDYPGAHHGEVTWRSNEPFDAKLVFQCFKRGRSAARAIFLDGDGRRLVVFLADLEQILKSGALVKFGVIRGTWCYCKRGENYGVQLVEAK